MGIYYLFLLLIIIGVLLEIFNLRSNRIYTKIIFLIGILIVGFRNNVGIDSSTYIEAFLKTPNLINFFFDFKFIENLPYKELLFIMYGSFIKLFTSDIRIYFLLYSLISHWLLFKVLNRYNDEKICLGYLVYYSRFFFLRDLNQMRSALAILLAIYFIKYIVEKKIYKYFLGIIIASTIHSSTIIGIPFYFIRYFLGMTRKKIISLLFFSLILLKLNIFSIISKFLIFNFKPSKLAYVDGEFVGKGNIAMIIFHILLLLIFFKYENILEEKIRDYKLIRMFYLGSTLILIFFYDFNVLAGRLSTIYSTLEIIIIPSLVYIFKQEKLATIGAGLLLILILSINILIRLGDDYLYF